MKAYSHSIYRFLVVIFLMLFSAAAAYPNPASDLTIHFTGMSPHLNQNLYLRVVDKGTLKETGRTMMQITNADFDVVIDAVTLKV